MTVLWFGCPLGGSSRMKPWRKCFAAVAATLAAALSLSALAQAYPEKPVTIIVPYPAGGVMDLTARALADGLTKQMSQPVLVVNRVGAGATMGGGAVASAPPDGYTLGFFPIAAAAPEVFRF